MAHCVISVVYDTDVSAMVMACVVHEAHAPCLRNGEPASPDPLHTDDRSGRDRAVRFWQIRTHGQRLLVVHHGSLGDKREHATEVDDTTCWCEPELLPARSL